MRETILYYAIPFLLLHIDLGNQSMGPLTPLCSLPSLLPSFKDSLQRQIKNFFEEVLRRRITHPIKTFLKSSIFHLCAPIFLPEAYIHLSLLKYNFRFSHSFQFSFRPLLVLPDSTGISSLVQDEGQLSFFLVRVCRIYHQCYK